MAVAITDFRIEVGYAGHFKLRLLRDQLGPQAHLCHLALIEYCATNQHDGCLYSLTPRQIEAAAMWNGTPGAFVDALASDDIHLLDTSNDGYSMHGWAEHQPYIAEAALREEEARHAAEARWNKHHHADSKKGNADFKKADAPTYQPTYLPTYLPTTDSVDATPIDAFDAFWVAYPRKVAKAAAKKAFEKKRCADQIEAILLAVARQRGMPQWQRDSGAYIPHPATWINAERWEDEIDPPTGRAAAQYGDPPPAPASGFRRDMTDEEYDAWRKSEHGWDDSDLARVKGEAV